MERVIEINDRQILWTYVNAHALTRGDVVILGGETVLTVQLSEWNPKDPFTIRLELRGASRWFRYHRQLGINEPVRLVIGGRTAGIR